MIGKNRYVNNRYASSDMKKKRKKNQYYIELKKIAFSTKQYHGHSYKKEEIIIL